MGNLGKLGNLSAGSGSGSTRFPVNYTFSGALGGQEFPQVPQVPRTPEARPRETRRNPPFSTGETDSLLVGSISIFVPRRRHDPAVALASPSPALRFAISSRSNVTVIALPDRDRRRVAGSLAIAEAASGAPDGERLAAMGAADRLLDRADAAPAPTSLSASAEPLRYSLRLARDNRLKSRGTDARLLAMGNGRVT